MSEAINRRKALTTTEGMMTTIDQAQRFLRVVDNLTPEQRSALLQAMEDHEAGRCTFEELMARTQEIVACPAAALVG